MVSLRNEMKKSIVLLVCVMLMCGLTAGCRNSNRDSAEILGVWKGSIDMTDHLHEGLSVYNPEFADVLALGGFTVSVIWRFEENGTYSMSVDPVAMEAEARNLIAQLRAGMYRHLENKIETEGLSLTVEELLTLADTDLDMLLEQALGEDPVSAIISAFKLNMSGNYELDNGKLYLSDNVDNKVDKDNYYTYELDGDKLVFKAGEFADSEAEEYAKIILPLELKKD